MTMKRAREIANLEFQIVWSINAIRSISTDKDITNRKSGRVSLMSFHMGKIRSNEKKLQIIRSLS